MNDAKLADEVLKALNNESYHSISVHSLSEYLNHNGIKISTSLVNDIIEYLEEDGYIALVGIKDSNYLLNSYKTTFKGKMFIESGCYTTKIEKSIYEKNSQKLIQWLLVVGTWAAAYALLAKIRSVLTSNYHYISLFGGVFLGIIVVLTAQILMPKKK